MTSEDEIKKHSYVVAPRIRWQGVLENPLPSFWSESLSKIWAGTDIETDVGYMIELFDMGHSPTRITGNQAKRQFGTLGKEPQIVPPEILELERHYSLEELRNMAWEAGLSPAGTKDILCLRLVRAKVLKL
jgi:hypothetical protein